MNDKMNYWSINNIRKSNGPGLDKLDFDVLLASALGINREFIHTFPEYRLNLWQYLKLIFFLYKLRRGYPVAYITGHKEFFGFDFFVNKHVLVPRPDTELIVEWAADVIRNATNTGKILLLDVGTGSGCIPIAIIKTLKRNNIETYCTDASLSALRVAKFNAKKHGVIVTLLHGDLLEPATSLFSDSYSLIVVTANLPYLTGKQFADEPSIQREPRSALVSDDLLGLSIYEKLFKQITQLPTIKCPFFVFFEIDPRQSAAAYELAKKYFPHPDVEIKKDLAGRDRVIKIFATN